jgi:hypothetical protein
MTRRAFLSLLSASFASVLATLGWSSTAGAADDDKNPPKELKVIAQATDSFPGKQKNFPRPVDPKGPLPAAVIRDVEELVAATGLKDKAKDEGTQKEVAATVAKALKVETIDWKSQMLVVIDEQEGINRSLTVGPFRVQDKSVNVTYNIDTRQGGAAIRRACRAILLVERWEGEIKFSRTFSKSGNPLAP